MKIKVSIIVPIFNTEPYLKECLDSLVSQTLSDIEIICVDDGSRDGSFSIIKDYSRKYSNIKIKRHLQNKGQAEARNTGLEMATGKYVMFVDSDDYVKNKSVCECLIEMAEEYKTDIIYYAYERLELDGTNSLKLNSSNKEVQSGINLFCTTTEEYRNRIEPCCHFYRRDFLYENNIRFLPKIFHEDDLFYYYTAMAAQRVIEINEVLYVYRQREGSTMHSPVNEIYVKSYFTICCKIFEHWINHLFSERENRAIGTYMYRNIVRFQHAKKSVGYDDGCWKLDYPEEFIYCILRDVYSSQMVSLSEEQLRRIEKAQKVVIYGTGSAAVDIVEELSRNQIKIDLAVISKDAEKDEEFCGIRVCNIDSLDTVSMWLSAVFIIATTSKYHDEIENKLKSKGFYDIIKPIEFSWKSPKRREK